MNNNYGEAKRLGLIPPAGLTGDELRKFIDNIDPDVMGFDGAEGPEDLTPWEIDDSLVAMAVARANIPGTSLTIYDNLTTVNYSNRTNGKKYLVIHYTAGTVDNGTAAKANTTYFKTEYRGASAHYFVDCTNNVYRCVSDDLVAWHCGANTYYHDYCRNSNSIGIEICSYKENGVYKFKPETVQNALLLARYIVKKYNIPKSNVVMHYHVTHKICAAPFMSNGKPSTAWTNFLNAIFDGSSIEDNSIKIQPLNKQGKVVNVNSNDVLNFRSGPGTNYDIIGSFKPGTILNITGITNGWYQIDKKGFVSGNYIQLRDGWCDDIRDELLNLKVITDKVEWTKYKDPITKALAVQLVSNASDVSPITSLQKALVEEALTRVGDTEFRPGDYRSGTLNQYCLGFVYAIFAKCKVPYKHIYNDAKIIKASDPSYHSGLDNIPLGAVVVWPSKTTHGHVGIYVGNGEVVHAYGAKGAIKTTIQKVINDGYTEVGWSWLGGTGAAMSSPNTHWAMKALTNLVSKDIVTDLDQWSTSLDNYISKGLYMALVCNMLGGVSDRYKNRKPDHWSRNCLDTLCDKGVVSDPKQWTDFEAQVSKELALAMIYKAIKVNK